MANCGDFIKSQFPLIDDDLKKYVEDILDNSAGEFEDTEEIYEAVGEVLQGISEKSENDIRDICEQLLHMLQPDKTGNINGPRKVLDAPIHLASMTTTTNDSEELKSIWLQTRDDNFKVDAKKLEKAEAKLQQKQQKQKDAKVPIAAPVLQTATASQVTSKKDSKLEAKGTNRTQDIRIENFDIAYGDRVLLQGADLVLAFGRRYGLVGRNGLGKTTLLRMISAKQLKIPSHISILHVEQEVVGDDTLALQSVLECDTVREDLIRREKEITIAINNGSTDPSLSTELSEVYAQLENVEADKAPARASIILSGLGFTTEMQNRATRTFSGGWRMRLALARALFSKPDLLLLDEPTNMLDIKAIIWLENYLQNWPTTLLVVSHDRNFLDTVPTDILHLHTQRIDTYRGNYEQFDKTKSEKHKNQQREYEAQQQQRAHMQEFIDRFRYNANRASSVQSKIKMLDRLPELRPVEKEIEVQLRFPETEPLSPPILQLNEVGFYYAKDKVIFSNVNLGATLESRICIVGDNGAGKTTLLKIIMGILSPTSGVRSVHRGLKFGYFSQHHVDQLDMNVNSVELLQKTYPGKPVEEYRRQLGSFGVSGDLALQTIASLSGGQKSRVAFAAMCMANPNFLVLDEPTNHLDIETIEALGKGINKYTGGVILVSHDERLIRMVCKELWVCGGGSVASVEGGFDEYRKIVERELEAQNK
ncbi:PREDICTED: ATP-binding cassette sub-family F member 3 [Papilio xuthus]|uniref:ATP-binding cassette sub-family F member 3 n=1 Tax=Papilio xuthus TaxID=66420 RepID=A0AAJ7ELL5_PAPXU|nr:PREDICTED: ATP-binding cassette sub-family F member 3 [Papilio xuthus]